MQDLHRLELQTKDLASFSVGVRGISRLGSAIIFLQ